MEQLRSVATRCGTAANRSRQPAIPYSSSGMASSQRGRCSAAARWGSGAVVGWPLHCGCPRCIAPRPDRLARARRGARREVKVLPRSVLAGNMPSGRPEPGVPRRRRKGAAKGADAASCGPLARSAGCCRSWPRERRCAAEDRQRGVGWRARGACIRAASCAALAGPFELAQLALGDELRLHADLQAKRDAASPAAACSACARAPTRRRRAQDAVRPVRARGRVQRQQLRVCAWRERPARAPARPRVRARGRPQRSGTAALIFLRSWLVRHASCAGGCQARRCCGRPVARRHVRTRPAGVVRRLGEGPVSGGGLT